MRRTLAIGGAVMTLGVVALSGTAGAHPVGSADEPTCFGERMSHGSSSVVAGGHGLTPVERRDLLEEFLGEEFKVGEVLAFVRTCPAP